MKRYACVAFLGLIFVYGACAAPTGLSTIADVADEAFISIVCYAKDKPFLPSLDFFGVRHGQPANPIQSTYGITAYSINLKTLTPHENVLIIKGASVYSTNVIASKPRSSFGGTIDSACAALSQVVEKDLKNPQDNNKYAHLWLKGVNQDPNLESALLTAWCAYNVKPSVFLKWDGLISPALQFIAHFSDTHRPFPFREEDRPKRPSILAEGFYANSCFIRASKDPLNKCQWVDFGFRRDMSYQSRSESIATQPGALVLRETSGFTIQAPPSKGFFYDFTELDPLEQLRISSRYPSLRSSIESYDWIVEKGEWIAPQSATLPKYDISPFDNELVSHDAMIKYMDALPPALLTMKFRKKNGSLLGPFYIRQEVLRKKEEGETACNLQVWFLRWSEADKNTGNVRFANDGITVGAFYTKDAGPHGVDASIFPKRFDLILRCLAQQLFPIKIKKLASQENPQMMAPSSVPNSQPPYSQQQMPPCPQHGFWTHAHDAASSSSLSLSSRTAASSTSALTSTSSSSSMASAVPEPRLDQSPAKRRALSIVTIHSDDDSLDGAESSPPAPTPIDTTDVNDTGHTPTQGNISSADPHQHG
jgi:hypothetical protein